MRVLLLIMVLILPSFANTLVRDGYVTDAAGIIDHKYHEYLEALFSALDTKTSAQVMIAAVPSLNGEDLAPYNIALFKQWNVGRAGKDNGVLFLIAVKERRMRIQTGYGLKDAFPDAEAKNVLHNIVRPLFKGSKMTEGITDGAEAIVDAAAKKYGITRESLGVKRPVQAPDTYTVPSRGDGARSFSAKPLFIVLSIILGAVIILLILIRSKLRGR